MPSRASARNLAAMILANNATAHTKSSVPAPAFADRHDLEAIRVKVVRALIDAGEADGIGGRYIVPSQLIAPLAETIMAIIVDVPAIRGDAA
jgi:hypothetical protein